MVEVKQEPKYKLGQAVLFINGYGMTYNKNYVYRWGQVVVDAGYNLTYKIYVSALFSAMSECTIENVVFNANYSYTKLPSESFYEDGNLVYVTDRVYYIALDENSVVEDVQVNVSIG